MLFVMIVSSASINSVELHFLSGWEFKPLFQVAVETVGAEDGSRGSACVFYNSDQLHCIKRLYIDTIMGKRASLKLVSS
jgi:hypothetical protein